VSGGGFFDASVAGLAVSEADFVIVGSGAGGGAAARVLASAGHRVAVLEEGPPFSSRDVGVLAGESMGRLLRHGGHMAALGRAAIPVLQGRVVGGTTTVNSAIIWRLPDKVLRRWHAEHGLAEGLPAAALDQAYGQLEQEMHVTEVADAIAGQSDRLMRLGAERAGIDHRPIHRNESGCRGSGRCLFGCPNDAKQGTAINFLHRAAADGATVHAHAGVARVLFQQGRAVAVAGRIGGAGPHAGRRFRVGAKRGVVVAASVVQSPNLLRRSGVGGAVGASGEALGEHFMAHPGSSVMGFYKEPVRAWTGPSQGYEAIGLRDTLGVKLESINVPPEITASRFPGAGARFGAYLSRLNHVANWAVAVRMNAEGQVRPSRLLGGDRIHYTPLPEDIRRLRDGMKRCAEMHFLAGATEVLSGIKGLPEVLRSADDLGVYDDAPLDPRCYSMVATHLFGTCRAGSDPRTSVVDPFLRVHGVQGLHVMDASVFPSNTGVNPQHSVMAIAMVAARRLAGG
jgi:choline dehydrogenase-like flavoprotein